MRGSVKAYTGQELMSNKVILLLGDIDTELADRAKQINKNATLITSDNYKSITGGVVYTSAGDFSNLKEFINAIELADTLIYSPPTKWSDSYKGTSNIQKMTETALLYFQNKKEIVGLDLISAEEVNQMLILNDVRKTESRQLWISGCSFSHGVGVSVDQRYGQLISDKINLPVSFLTAGGSSIEWAADQIIRSDIRSGDVIVWGLTTSNRIPYYSKQKNRVVHITSESYTKLPEFNKEISINKLHDVDSKYRALTRIYEVINFCKKLNVQLVIVGLLLDEDFIPYTINLPNYIQLFRNFKNDMLEGFLDVGDDNIHPGPLTHQWYADQIINKIKL